ncbi:MAG TPA: SUMF1/EgtB/PvdO family nonheme iron enzyme, partial [Pirellulales bacterium]|nr:SUMF1/EgtB/PvdO family nonheme iron enzyme [Pirellulales bacterium]
MTVQNATCPPKAMLSDFGLGKLDAASAETVGRHIETCDACRQRVAGISGDSFVGRLRQAGGAAQPAARRERTYVPGESLANMANSTDGSSVREDGLPRPSRTADDQPRRDGLGSPSSPVSAPPELTNHPDYELIKELGQGGMGTVYLAKNRMMDRLEVLKVISKALLDRPGALERFQQEIRSAAKLLHPNIVAAHAVLRPGDLLVFAMEYVRGQDLSEVVKQRGPLPVANAAFYIHQVANGLQHAFEKGMVHRDIKPNNLMLAIEGKKHTVKILDFGLAKATSEKGAEAGLTKSGQMLGTPDYVAPEQTLDAHNADIRADIYSLGCTLYFLLSGGPPFQETSLYAILEAHHKREPKPLNLVRPDVPVELATVVGKMMAKEPAKRYQTPAEVAKALVPFFKPGQATATSRPTDAGPLQPVSESVQETGATAPALPISSPRVPLAPLPVSVVAPAPLPAAESEAPFGVSIDTDRPVVRRRRWWSSLAPARPAARFAKPHQPGSPWRPGRNTWLAGGGGALLLMAGIVFFLPTKDGLIRVEIDDPQIEVTIKGTEIVLKKADNGRDVKLSAGEKTLVVERGDFKFETDKLILKKGENVTVAVTLSAGQVKVKQGDKLLGQAKLSAVWHGWPADAPQPAIAPFSSKQAKQHQQAWAKYLKLPVEHTNSIGMRFVLIPPGEFMMGSTAAEIEEALKVVGENKDWQEQIRAEAPQHKVVLTQPIYLGVHEVTQKEYEAVVGKNPSYFAKTGLGAQWVDKVPDLDTAAHPVEDVSWNDAAEFCAELSKQEELKPFYFRAGETATPLKGAGYRFPTEAEWKFACRAGSTTRFWSGDREQDLVGAGWFRANSGGITHEVEELASNPFGLFDVHGNVWEWVEDSWEPTYYAQFQKTPAVDPTGPPSAGSLRLIRGGSWLNAASQCQSDRYAYPTSTRAAHVGFRVLLPVAAVKNALSRRPSTVDTGGHERLTDTPPPAIAPFDAKQALAHQEAWAKHLDTKVEIENSLGMKLRLIPPGEFMMGSPQAEIDAMVATTTAPNWQGWFRSEGPRHRVNLTKAFYLSSCEVTQQQYQELMGVNPSYFSLNGPGKDAVKDLDTSRHPVEMVSWFDAVGFCSKLSEKERRRPYYLRDGETVKVLGGTGYRLPTEAEWEFACRAGKTTRWSFGDNETKLGQYAWFNLNAGHRTHRIADLPANPFGLYDVHGNVWEWCWDWKGDYAAGAISDPSGPATGTARVLRGAAFDLPFASAYSSAFRGAYSPTKRTDGSVFGFRVARTIDAKNDASRPAAAGGSAAGANDTDTGTASVNQPPLAIAPFDAKQALAHQEAWAKHLGTEVEVENSLGMKLRLIPPGEFTMGSPQEEMDALVQSTAPYFHSWFRSEGPRHRVKLTQAFYLSNCEVTQRQYQELMGANPSHFSLNRPGKDAVKDQDTGQHPVEMVSWFDAVDSCNKLSEREQRPPYYVRDGDVAKILGGTGYRLPTEAEWECACRAGTTTRWSFGDSDTNLPQYAWVAGNAGGRTHRVAELFANPFGVYDLHGNAWEWCWDWHGAYAAVAVSDPTGPSAGTARALRG